MQQEAKIFFTYHSSAFKQQHNICNNCRMRGFSNSLITFIPFMWIQWLVKFEQMGFLIELCIAAEVCLSFITRTSPVSAIKDPVCTPPEKPMNGYLLPIYGPKQELVSVNYRCHPPFKLIGSQQRICLPNSTWSGPVPSCVKGTFSTC